MKCNTAFQLSAIALALTSSMTFAVTVDTSNHPNDDWNSARDPHVGSVDTSAYQYVDLGSAHLSEQQIKDPQITNQLTELYRTDDKSKFVVKISPLGSDSAPQGIVYDIEDEATIKNALLNYLQAAQTAGTDPDLVGLDLTTADWLKNVTDKSIAEFFTSRTAADTPFKTNPLEAVAGANPISINTDMVYLAGLTKYEEQHMAKTMDIRRLDSSYLEYADSTREYISAQDHGGNLTNDDKSQSLVLANVDKANPNEITTLQRDRGVLTGILNNKNADDQQINPDDTAEIIKNRQYGLKVHQTEKKYTEQGQFISEVQESSVITEKDITISRKDDTKYSATVISAEGISTGSLTVDGINVGQTLANTAALGNLTVEEFDAILNSGTAIQANTTAIAAESQARIDGDAATLTAANNYTDEKVLAVTADLTIAANEYTDTKSVETLAAADTAAKAGDVTTLASAKTYSDTKATETLAIADTAAKAGDAATLTSANAYTDAAVSGFSSSINGLSKRLDKVEEAAYRGTAIALAAAQQVPNIKAGQFALFGGVGHYEGETAVAAGGIYAVSETVSLSGALGTAGSEVGGRVGASFIFGGN